MTTGVGSLTRSAARRERDNRYSTDLHEWLAAHRETTEATNAMTYPFGMGITKTATRSDISLSACRSGPYHDWGAGPVAAD